MKLNELLKKNFFKDDIKDTLYELNLPVSGNMDELIKRLLKSTKNDPVETLNVFNKEDLQIILENYDLPKSGKKADLIDRIVDKLLDVPKKKERPVEKKLMKTKERPINQIETPIEGRTPTEPPGFDALLLDIRNWSPHDRYPSEGEYRLDLYHYLNGKGYRTRMEKGESRTDILVDEKIPIEMKKSPNKQKYRLAFGQIKDHCKAYSSCIAVICDVKKLDEYEDFQEDVRDLLQGFKTDVIRK
jgi:hypothetical protein